MSLPEYQEGFRGARVVLGVTGGIAAYKAAELTSKLIQLGATVNVVMSEGATKFVQPLTFEALTRNAVYTSVYDGWHGDSAGHVTLARDADVVIVAPATANTVARMAQGAVEDMLGAVLLATQAPIIIAPAMEHHMWHHLATQRNLDTLNGWGVEIVSPEKGHLASGAEGDGRLATLDRLLGAIRVKLGAGGKLSGKTIVVTAGGTREALDPVRYLGNRSSGRMGVGIAEAAVDAGASVVLIAGPTVERIPAGMDVRRVESAVEMSAAVDEAVKGADALIMAAAVADYRPKDAQVQKIKKSADQSELTLELVQNPDIIASVDKPGLVKIGFAAETEQLHERAQQKLVLKDLAMIVANDAVATIGQDTAKVTLLFRDGREPVCLSHLPKSDVARRIVAETALLVGVENDD